MDESLTREIEEAVQRALGAGGIQGTVNLTGRTITLRAGGAPTEIDALYLIEQWPLLPGDLRERKAADLAVRLAEAQRSARAGVASPSTSSAARLASIRPTGQPARGPGRPIVVPAGALALVALLGALGWLWFKGRSSGPAPGASASAPPPTPEERTRTVCESARAQVLRTGTLAHLDAQVWLAELWLATSRPGEDLSRAKGLAGLVDQGKLTAGADPELAAIREARVEIVGEEAGPGLSFRGMHVRFHGGYVSAFFETAGRERMNVVAGKLADATGAEVGALYARCAHLRYHDIGAWFRGSSPGLAAGALVYSMGLFSERRLTNHDPSTPATASDLAALTAAVAKVDHGKLEASVRDSGGTFAPGVGGAPTLIVFPLGGPTRAARASGQIATHAGMGADAPRPGASASP